MGVTHEVFYDPKEIAILPMGFCYPGSGKTGDLPPGPSALRPGGPRCFDTSAT